MIVIVLGVSGAGKTTVGRLLARKLGWRFDEADDFHSQASIEQMRAGSPLTDEERMPWLQKLRELIERRLAANENAVLACSALKKAYRQILRVNEQVRFVYLRGSPERITNQLQQRHGHFMNPQLLQSQLDTLEEPGPEEGAITVELGGTPEELAEEIRKRLNC